MGAVTSASRSCSIRRCSAASAGICGLLLRGLRDLECGLLCRRLLLRDTYLAVSLLRYASGSFGRARHAVEEVIKLASVGF